MERKDIKVGMRVRPSGQGFTKQWPDLSIAGRVIRIGKNFILVQWDDRTTSGTLKPMHLERA